MAAPSAAEQTTPKVGDDILKPVCTTEHRVDSFSENTADVQEHVVDFLEKEVGSDIKSLRNVVGLLDKVREEKRVLEEQVVTVSSCVPPKVRAAVRAAEEATSSVQELLQRERLISNTLQQ
ncbi:hypothetical protein LDENG_00275700, partial [Lucifuga dentata]